MGGEKKPLVMSDLGCADGCGRQMGAENCADGCGRRGCKGVAGNGWGEEAAGDERPWLRGRLRTANGCGELRGWLRTAWVQRTAQRSGWKWVGRRERKGNDGKGRDRKGWERKEKGRERKGKEGKGRERKGKEGKGRERKGKDGKGRVRKGKDGKGTEKDRKGRERNGADGCGRPGCKGVAGNGWGEEAAGDERPWLRGRLRTANGCGELRGRLRTAWVQGRERMGKDRKRIGKEGKGMERTAADGVGAREWLEMGGEKKPLGDERPWLRGRLRTANGCGELRGRLRTAWVQGGGWKWVERRSRW